MFDATNKIWVSEISSDKQINAEINKTEEQFLKADYMLAECKKKRNVSEAVYEMQLAAEKGSGAACYAMGQMFQYGWCVSKSRKKALEWYKRSSVLSYDPADSAIAELTRKKINPLFIIIPAGLLIAAAIVFACIYFFRQKEDLHGVYVSNDTLYKADEDFVDLASDLLNIKSEFDGNPEEGKEIGSNRLVVMYEGYLDLREFNPVKVLSDNDGICFVQFMTEAEADACMQKLKQLQNVIAVSKDLYSGNTNGYPDETDHAGTGAYITQSKPPYIYQSAYTGCSYLSWGVEQLGYDMMAAWLTPIQKETVIVGVCDTGVEPHTETQSRILRGYNACDNTMNGCIDHNGHGTHVSGIILDCTQGLDVKVLPIKLEDTGSGFMQTSTILTGILYAINEDVDVINLSLGGSLDDEIENVVINKAISSGIVVVVSAGNGDEYGIPIDTAGLWPASNMNAIVVGAVDISEKIALFSNYGVSLDCAAPGVSVMSYYKKGTFKSLDGTSMAAPHISALAAMIRAYCVGADCQTVEKYIKRFCIYHGDEMFYGKGIPDCRLYIEY